MRCGKSAPPNKNVKKLNYHVWGMYTHVFWVTEFRKGRISQIPLPYWFPYMLKRQFLRKWYRAAKWPPPNPFILGYFLPYMGLIKSAKYFSRVTNVWSPVANWVLSGSEEISKIVIFVIFKMNYLLDISKYTLSLDGFLNLLLLARFWRRLQ